MSAIQGSASRNDYGATGWPARQFLVYTFDDYDAVIIVEFESDMHALSVMLADVAGQVGATKVTALFPMEDAVAAMKVAQSIEYRAPST